MGGGRKRRYGQGTPSAELYDILMADEEWDEEQGTTPQ